MRNGYRRYDPRLKNLVAASGDIEKFSVFGISKSTLRQWVKDGPREFFTLPELKLDSAALVLEILDLKARLAAVQAKENLVVTTIKIFGFQIQYRRLSSAEAKTEIIAAINNAAQIQPLAACLAAIGLSAARFHHWLKRQVHCQLNDQPSCPRVSPMQILTSETNKIRELYTSKDYSHYSVASLCCFAKKVGSVMVSPSTWSRVVRQLGLKRDHIRIYPPKPKIGIRATRPGQIWHLDLTKLRLQDGTRAFVQAVIDNYSRYVLAWKVSKEYGGLATKELLLAAMTKAQSLGLKLIPNVYVDSGTENLNEHIDLLVSSNLIFRTIAQIDIEFSNSMIEMLFYRLKHRYLFTIPLTNFLALEKGAEFYFVESNTRIPHSALKGATPEEVMMGKWTDTRIQEIKTSIENARKNRRESNRSIRCLPCLA